MTGGGGYDPMEEDRSGFFAARNREQEQPPLSSKEQVCSHEHSMAYLVDRYTAWRRYECPYCKIDQLQRALDQRNEQIDGYEKQLGIDQAGAERTIGSEIERLLHPETSAGPIPPSIPEGSVLYGYHERSGLHRWNSACPEAPGKGDKPCSPVYMHPDVFKALVALKTPAEPT
jgi:hypothetical protein